MPIRRIRRQHRLARRLGLAHPQCRLDRPRLRGELNTFVAINARLWTRIAGDDPQPWKLALRHAATRWQSYRHS